MSRIETFTWLAPSGILNDTGDAPDMRIAKDSGSRAMAVVEITHMVKMAVVEPAALLAVTVKSAYEVVEVVGVPEMMPVKVSSTSPVGSAGETDQRVIVPVTLGVFGAIA